MKKALLHCTLDYHVKQHKGGLAKSQLRVVLDYIDTQLHEDRSLDVLAALTGLNSYHFLRLFKRSIGETPLQFIIRSRMEQAKKLLASPRASVTDVAMDVGYESASHFITSDKVF